MNINIKLPLPPTTNHFHVPVKMGKYVRLITSPKVKKYQKQLSLIMDQYGLSNLMINEPVIINLIVNPARRGNFDVSNRLKAYEDGLEKCGFIENDSLIEYGFILKGEVIKDGGLSLNIRLKKDTEHVKTKGEKNEKHI